jgi:hypothetical protein
MEIRINIYLAREQPNNMTHESHTDTTSGTVHDDYQRVQQGPPYPSAGLPHDTYRASMGGLRTILVYIR